VPALDALGLVVAEMPATLAFYRRRGLDLPAGADTEEHVEVTAAGGLRLMFDTVDLVRSFSEWEPPSGGHRVALAFLCASPAEVDATHDDLVSAGHRSHLAPFDAFWGQRYATVLDPDGNPVDLFAPLG
jgi:uncharacterized glyoxalase superfamily protein PhnB